LQDRERTRRPDVLLLSTRLSDGGAERVTSTLLRGFDRSVVAPSLCLLRDDVSYPLPDDVTVHHVGYAGLPTLWRTARRLRRVVEETRPDVLLSNANATNFLAGLALRSSRHRPAWVARISGAPEQQDIGLRSLAGRWVYPRVDRFVVNSEGVRAAMQRKYPFSSDRIERIVNPLNAAEVESKSLDEAGLPSRPQEPLLVAAGRLSREKRYDLMLDAVARVRRSHPVTLWICGDGPERQRLAARTAELGLDPHVQFLGFVANPYPAMRQADIFVMTSDHEGLPNALIEAQSLGVPVVSTRCPHGPDEIVEHEVGGLLVPVGDAAAMAEAITQLVERPERRAAMGRAGALAVRQKFDADEVTRRWEALLVDLTRGH
jgi:glycosyltransferase involved in cell wall biosynthesis